MSFPKNVNLSQARDGTYTISVRTVPNKSTAADVADELAGLMNGKNEAYWTRLSNEQKKGKALVQTFLQGGKDDSIPDGLMISAPKDSFTVSNIPRQQYYSSTPIFSKKSELHAWIKKRDEYVQVNLERQEKRRSPNYNVAMLDNEKQRGVNSAMIKDMYGRNSQQEDVDVTALEEQHTAMVSLICEHINGATSVEAFRSAIIQDWTLRDIFAMERRGADAQDSLASPYKRVKRGRDWVLPDPVTPS